MYGKAPSPKTDCFFQLVDKFIHFETEGFLKKFFKNDAAQWAVLIMVLMMKIMIVHGGQVIISAKINMIMMVQVEEEKVDCSKKTEDGKSCCVFRYSFVIEITVFTDVMFATSITISASL